MRDRLFVFCALTSALAGCDGARIAAMDAGPARDDGPAALDARDHDVADVGPSDDAREPDDTGTDAGEPLDTGPSDAGPVDAGEPDASGEVLLEDTFEDTAVDPQWTLWRTAFEEREGALSALPMARPGFDYGHGGNGRSGIALTHLMDVDWTDYRVEARVRAHAPDPAFNSAGIAECDRGFYIWVRVARAQESWNTEAQTAYLVFVRTDGCGGDDEAGDWAVLRDNDYYFAGTGCCAMPIGTRRVVATGSGAATDADDWNDVVIEIRGTRIRGWIGGELAIDVEDDAAGTIGFGGVAVTALLDNPFDIDSIRVVEIE